jgi:hypothetical protein
MDIQQLRKEIAWYTEEIRVIEYNLREAEEYVKQDVLKMEEFRLLLAENSQKLHQLQYELEIAEREQGGKSGHSSNEFEYF